MTYAQTAQTLEFAEAQRATHVTLEVDFGEVDVTLAEALEGWRELAPGEAFSVVSLHWRDGVAS